MKVFQGLVELYEKSLPIAWLVVLQIKYYLLSTRVEVDKTRVNIDNLDDVNEEICQEFYENKDFDMDTLKRGGKYGKYKKYSQYYK